MSECFPFLSVSNAHRSLPNDPAASGHHVSLLVFLEIICIETYGIMHTPSLSRVCYLLCLCCTLFVCIQALMMAFTFGFFQGLMPLLGFLCGNGKDKAWPVSLFRSFHCHPVSRLRCSAKHEYETSRGLFRLSGITTLLPGVIVTHTTMHEGDERIQRWKNRADDQVLPFVTHCSWSIPCCDHKHTNDMVCATRPAFSHCFFSCLVFSLAFQNLVYRSYCTTSQVSNH